MTIIPPLSRKQTRLRVAVRDLRHSGLGTFAPSGNSEDPGQPRALALWFPGKRLRGWGRSKATNSRRLRWLMGARAVGWVRRPTSFRCDDAANSAVTQHSPAGAEQVVGLRGDWSARPHGKGRGPQTQHSALCAKPKILLATTFSPRFPRRANALARCYPGSSPL